jgi:poly-gamma-glutamate capsule biosynthesis protein CapA/YwtB (metallophosphatase superfamily)
MLRFIVLVFCAFLASATPLQADEIAISGLLGGEGGTTPAGARVEINGVSARPDADGRWLLRIPAAEVYRAHFQADNHYSAVHTFSPLELDWLERDGVSEIPGVTLVGKRPGRVMMTFGGDAMMGRRFSNPYPGDPVLIREGHEAEDTRALLRHMKPYLELADFASVNLESQVMNERPEAKAPKSYVFFTPPAAVAALRDAGIDYVTLGNNHSNDYLEAGLASTLEALERAGLPFSGAGLDESSALSPFRTRIGETRWSFLGYVGWAGNFSPNQVAEGSAKGGAALGSPGNIARAVEAETRDGFMPVIQYHGSREYTDEPTLVTETRLKQAIDRGAALAIAHHPHVVQGFEIYEGRLIAYSMGNFIFDQFHYATRFSYVVHVWMDGDRLHRAEVVPIHLQGYIPVPATDTVRNAVLRRTHTLSARRGVRMTVSGGHGVIDPDHAGAETGAGTLAVTEQKALLPLHAQPWNQPVSDIRAEGPDAHIRLGKNLLPMGHLENHDRHGAGDRSWIQEGPQSVITSDDGNRVMRLRIPAGASQGRVGMRTFEYTFEPGTPSTFAARVRVDAPATVTAYQQWRGRNDNRMEALANNRLRPIGQAEVSPGGWRTLQFDFDSPRVSAVSYRVVMRVTPADSGRSHESLFDDFALIEWLTPPLKPGPVPAHLETGQASHAEILR